MAAGVRKIAGVFIALILIVVVVASIAKSKHLEQAKVEGVAVSEAGDNPPTGEPSEASEQGSLIVWVPAGWTGDDYWVYLDGHLVSSPPHGTRNKFWAMAQKTQDESNRDNGWDIEDGNEFGSPLAIRNGYFLETENYRNYIAKNLDPVSGDAKGLFYHVDLPIQSGKYVVEIAYLLRDSYSSFPFTISPKYSATVAAGRRTQLHIGVPDDWRDMTPARAARTWGGCEGKPDVNYLEKELNTYLDDREVQALMARQASSSSESDEVVVLQLPMASGGPRELDKSQIKYVAKAILLNYWDLDHGPSQSDIEECKNSHPEWSSSFDEYAKTLGVVQSAFQPIHALAGK